MYGCESRTIKKAECQRIDAFELQCWRRLLRVPWTAGRSNQSILKEISPGYSLEGQMLNWSSNTWPPEVKSWLTGKDHDAGKDWRQEEKGQQRMRWLDYRASLTQWNEFEQTLGDSAGQGSLACCSPSGHKELDTTQWLNDNKMWQEGLPRWHSG